MGKMEGTQGEISTPEQQAAQESHYHSKKDRIFVRAIAGKYSLGDELAKLRAMPRVRKAADLKFRDGPQTYSRHYVEPRMASRRPSTSTSRNTAPVAAARSTAT